MRAYCCLVSNLMLTTCCSAFSAHRAALPVSGCLLIRRHLASCSGACSREPAGERRTSGVEAEGGLTSVERDGDRAARVHRLHQRLIVVLRHVRVALPHGRNKGLDATSEISSWLVDILEWHLSVLTSRNGISSKCCNMQDPQGTHAAAADFRGWLKNVGITFVPRRCIGL